MIRFIAVSGTYALAAAILFAVAMVMSARRVAPSGFVPAEALAVPVTVATSSTILAEAEGVAHAATAIVLPDGRIAAYWFAGSREGAGDVTIRMAILDDSEWSTPRTVTGARQTGDEQRRYVKTVGNPVVFRHPGGEYWLVYVSVSVGGWSGSALNLMRSADGIVWGPSQRLFAGPFANVSTLVKGPALVRADGLVVLPAYHEFIAAYPELLVIDGAGRIVDKIRIDGGCRIQPWVVPLDADEAFALMRPFGCPERVMWVSRTGDAGATWSPPAPTGLANPGSPAAALALPDGRIVAVLNDDSERPDVLDLVVSLDRGRTWERRAPVFDGSTAGNSYRYPWLLQDGEGRLHVFATEAGKAIRHAILGADALDALPAE